MKIYGIFLIVLLLALQYKFWFEEGGYFHNRELQRQLAAARAENEKLKDRNRALARRVLLVKEDMNEIESLARRELGMIKEGEEFMFLIEGDASVSNNAPNHNGDAAAALPPE